MKKLFKIVIISFLILTSLQMVLFFFDDASLLGFPYFAIRADGFSMNPTIADNEIVIKNPFDKAVVVGKIMVLTIDLKNKEYVSATTGMEKVMIIKRIVEINENKCIWLEGDNIDELSGDSRDYGWLCPDQYKITGTIIGK